MKRSVLDRLVLEQRLNESAAAAALDVTGARPDRAAWRVFLATLFNGAGLAALGAGVIFFVAANWQDYGVIGRFALLQVAFAACVGLALWRPPPGVAGQSGLVLAIVLAGTLLALFGQTYQTGADVYELFFAWAALTIPFAVASRSGAAWGTWWTVLNVGLALYCGLPEPSLGRILWAGSPGIERPTLLFLAAVINLGGSVLFTQLALPHWVARVAATYGFLFGTVACIVVIVKGAGHDAEAAASKQGAIVILGFLAACLALAYDTLRRRLDVFPMAAIIGSWIAISTAFLIRLMTFDNLAPVFVIALWLIATSSAAGFVLMKWVREWRA